ncbi:hypothetical protein [Patulibacter sp. SYSU D01012]|uniref:hypothetical protein n=1 Tax=Patulibacter sp. SYSU D01012 TaxID=2817381 RepID=UPI001B30EBA0|nr:hypothetical protein [Patulibacter sp. SYSU D01012]
MSGASVTFDEPDEPAGPPPVPATAPDEQPADPPPAPATAPAGSILGELAEEIAADVAEEYETYAVGKHRRLRARYRALDDAEVQRLTKIARGNVTLQRKTGQELSDIEVQNRGAALLLSAACVELLWVEDNGDETPIHVLIAREVGDDAAPSGPLRYDIGTLEKLMPERAERLRAEIAAEGRQVPTSADVAAEMHRWGEGANYAPLRARGQELQMWSSSVSAQAIGRAIEGS